MLHSFQTIKEIENKIMLKHAVNICLISFFVIHLASAGDAINNKNRRVKRLGAQKFKKGEKNL